MPDISSVMMEMSASHLHFIVSRLLSTEALAWCFGLWSQEQPGFQITCSVTLVDLVYQELMLLVPAGAAPGGKRVS